METLDIDNLKYSNYFKNLLVSLPEALARDIKIICLIILQEENQERAKQMCISLTNLMQSYRERCKGIAN